MFGGTIVTLLLLGVGLYFGHYVLRMNPILILGSRRRTDHDRCDGRHPGPIREPGRCPRLTPVVPIGHILLTTWGTVIVNVIGFLTNWLPGMVLIQRSKL